MLVPVSRQVLPADARQDAARQIEWAKPSRQGPCLEDSLRLALGMDRGKRRIENRLSAAPFAEVGLSVCLR